MKKTPAATKVTTSVRGDADFHIVNGAEPRVDSRLIAKQLGIQHKNALELLRKHRTDFEQLGKVAFQTEPLPSGQAERFGLLNEDQSYLMLTFSRNTSKVRALKVRLVKAFAEARKAAAIRQAEYLPTFHAVKERLHELADGSPKERFLHINVAKLVNKAVGLESGQRPGAPLPKQSLLVVAEMLALAALEKANDLHDVQRAVKTALAPLVGLQALQGGVA